MSITTRSVFYYGHLIDETNLIVDFQEGVNVLQAFLNVGAYTLTDFAVELARALTEAGTQEYSVSVDRATRKLTVSAASNFSLLVASGGALGTSTFSLMGFTGADRTGANSYEGNNGSGFEFVPQFLLQEYIAFEHWRENINSAVNQSSSGLVEVITYGQVYFMQCNITFQTNINQGSGNAIETDSDGVESLLAFLEYTTLKAPVEFMPNRNSRNTFYECLLESTPEEKNGTSYKLKELYGKGLPNYYESGTLKFRKVS